MDILIIGAPERISIILIGQKIERCLIKETQPAQNSQMQTNSDQDKRYCRGEQ